MHVYLFTIRFSNMEFHAIFFYSSNKLKQICIFRLPCNIFYSYSMVVWCMGLLYNPNIFYLVPPIPNISIREQFRILLFGNTNIFIFLILNFYDSIDFHFLLLRFGIIWDSRMPRCI